MPYLQLDVTGTHSVASKKRLAAQMSRTYAEMMSVDIRRISVAIRELGEGGVWRIPDAGGLGHANVRLGWIADGRLTSRTTR